MMSGRHGWKMGIGVWAWVMLLMGVGVSWGQEAAPEAEKAAEKTVETKAEPPQTTGDPTIPVDQLEFLLKPLTMEELGAEADGWRDLLKAKVAEISEVEIARKRANETVAEEAEEITDKAEEKAPEDKTKAVEKVAMAKAEKEEVLQRLPELQEEKTALLDRLNSVLAELEKKGGDIESYKTYASAVSGITIDTSDASATWTAVTGWLTSDEGGKRWLWNLLRFVGILFASYLISKVVGKLVYRATAAMPQASALLRDFLSKFVRQVIMFIGLIAALAALEVNIGPLLAAIGAAGLVVGLALQDTLGNFAAGLLMLAYRPFDVGHVIDAGGVLGKVESMNMVSTHIKTFDNRHVIVPNNQIWGGTITNASVSDNRRVDLTFGIGYDDDMNKAQEILERLVREHPKVLDDPEPLIKVNELADSSINFICWPWCKAADYGEVKWGLLRSVKEEFDRNGISIPYPQRDVHVYQKEGAGVSST